MFKKIKSYIKNRMEDNSDDVKFMIGKQLCFSQKSMDAIQLSDIEFKVFSQNGEDGIIEYLVTKIPIKNKFFIEFGVENYNESNTRFLMMNRNWGGVIMDGSQEYMDYVTKRNYFWKYDLNPIACFITRENINKTIRDKLLELNIDRDIGILSIDIDGVDYWILEEIDCIVPSIIICEYNPIFGHKHPLTVPYDKNFQRTKSHFSNLYWGASLPAFSQLLEKRGYSYVGSNMTGMNAFFVKKDLTEKYLPANLLKNANKKEKFNCRDSRSEDGNLSYIRGDKRFDTIKHLEVIDLNSGAKKKLEEFKES